MELKNICTAAQIFYRMTLGRFYTLDEKRRLFYLIAVPCEIEQSQINESFDCIKELEQDQIYTLEDTKLFIMISRFESSQTIRQMVLNALKAVLIEFSQQGNFLAEIYATKTEWYQNIYGGTTPEKIFEKALIEYACGRIAASINSFEKIINKIQQPILQYLSIISMEGQCFQKAFEYAIRGQFVVTKTEKIYMNIPFLADIEQRAGAQLDPNLAEGIRNKARSEKIEPTTIGFSC